MKIENLDKLKKTNRSGQFFDLFEARFRYPNIPLANLGLQSYTVQKGEEMRIDLVCQSIYNKIDYVDFLCFLNDLKNPLNIAPRQEILWVTEENISIFIIEPKSDDVISQIVKANRGTRKDPSREEFLSNNLQLPPNILEEPVEQVVVRGSLIRIGNGG